MYKVKCTRSDLYASYSHIIKIPYCDAEDLLSYAQPVAYNCGVYGWNYDVYERGITGIVTGYRMNIEGIYPSRKTLKKYNEKAKIIIKKYDKYSTKKAKLDMLIDKFIAEVKKENLKPVIEYTL